MPTDAPDALGSRGFEDGRLEDRRAFFQMTMLQSPKTQRTGPSGEAAPTPGQAAPLPAPPAEAEALGLWGAGGTEATSGGRPVAGPSQTLPWGQGGASAAGP